ncbi:hypothetical protein Nepgr_027579 [Nepenthes gracilis]|uniref:Uncharacterized protein n=1 Tax=Nepenthes gracilis TaxID=150966 RepID=A0AAD3TAR5_NEPGR|nr:hypothetical protein Nepgr_027579 [Nepenthes gracilis]
MEWKDLGCASEVVAVRTGLGNWGSTRSWRLLHEVSFDSDYSSPIHRGIKSRSIRIRGNGFAGHICLQDIHGRQVTGGTSTFELVNHVHAVTELAHEALHNMCVIFGRALENCKRSGELLLARREESSFFRGRKWCQGR